MSDDIFDVVTPGEILNEEFLKGYELSQSKLARAIDVSPNRIAEIINNRRAITADTALRLPLRPENGPAAAARGTSKANRTRRCLMDDRAARQDRLASMGSIGA